jgi:predicted dehydrogenase
MLARESLDAVVVAAPTRHHWEIARCALEHDLHVLVEKPIASDVDEAQDLVAAAASAQCMLMVGHIERFNPAVRELRRRLARGELGRVYRVHTRRCGPFPKRIRDVGVVIDLATHDLDVMAYLLRAAPVRLYAETARRINTAYEDMLNALIRFEDDVVGVLEVDWLTPTKVRDLSVLGERGMFRVDYLSQDLFFYQNDSVEQTWRPGDGLTRVSEGDVLKVRIERQEALAAELVAFAAAARGDGPPVVTADDGLEALRLAEAIVCSGLEHREISPQEVSRA